MKTLHASFKRFSQTGLSARSILVNLSLEKNLTSNRPKPIGVLTRTKSSHSDLRLPLGYLLPDFQPHRSNFFAPPAAAAATAAAALPGRKGVDTGGNRAHRTFVPVSSSRNNGLHPCYLLLKSQLI